MVSSTSRGERQPPRKAILYCPNCSHESRINGDWLIQVHAHHLDYECPDCGDVIESRVDGPGLITPT